MCIDGFGKRDAVYPIGKLIYAAMLKIVGNIRPEHT